ncbi:MAG: hypothetical protein ACW97A_13575 [Candidatus Thorarchaeota archaeon]|jgi:hypothetical protein
MLFSDPRPTGQVILFGAMLASLILGILLGTYKGKLSETTKLTRLGFLLVLALAVGSTVYIWMFLFPLSIYGYSIFRYFSPLEVLSQYLQGIAPLLIITIVSSLICGAVSMICPNTKQE